MKRISVVIPVYNAERTIERVLDSVLGQTAFDEILEIIVVNDGSTDNSADIVKKYVSNHPSTPIIFVSQENKGASAARNLGMRRAQGEYIAFLDSDDVWLPFKIERQINVLEKHPEIVFLGAGYKDTPFYRRGRKIEKLFKAEIRDIYWSFFPVTPSVIFKREAIDRLGYFDESQRYCEDIGYFQKFCVYFNYFYLPEKLVTIGIDKDFFGAAGLTSNIKGMHEGELKNLRWLMENRMMTVPEYLFFRLYMELKFYLRVMIRRIRRFKNSI